MFRMLLTNRIEQAMLKNLNFSVLSKKCVGFIMLHDICQSFDSPTVNQFMNSRDFINGQYCQHIGEKGIWPRVGLCEMA